MKRHAPYAIAVLLIGIFAANTGINAWKGIEQRKIEAAGKCTQPAGDKQGAQGGGA